MLKKAFFVLLLLPVFSFASQAHGETLLNHLWNAMKDGKIKHLKEYTSPNFQSVHFDGARSRAQELQLIANLHMQSFTLSDIKVTEEHDLYIISYIAQVQELIDGQPVTETAPRLTVFKKINNKWKWVAHASLVSPVLQ